MWRVRERGEGERGKEWRERKVDREREVVKKESQKERAWTKKRSLRKSARG